MHWNALIKKLNNQQRDTRDRNYFPQQIYNENQSTSAAPLDGLSTHINSTTNWSIRQYYDIDLF